MNRFTSIFLVLVQFTCLTFLFIRISFVNFSALTYFLFFTGLFIGCYALFEMRKSKFSVFPSVRPGARVLTSGPYKFIRHPMYLAVLLTGFSCCVQSNRAVDYIVFFVLFSVLYAKIIFEELMLIAVFPEYVHYLSSTKRIIPWVW